MSDTAATPPGAPSPSDAGAPDPVRPTDEPRPPRSPRTPRESRPRRESGAGGPKPPPAPRPSRSSNRERIRAGLLETYVGIGGGLNLVGMVRGDVGFVATGQAVVAHAEQAADAWLTLADNNPAVMRALATFVEGSALAAVLAAHVPMVLPLLQSRGVLGETMQQAQHEQAAAEAARAAASAMNGDPIA